jgi:hypothetical protein
MRLVPVVLLAALAVALHAPAGAARAPARAKKPAVPVRAVIVSGDRQTARSYVATAAKAYDAEFRKPLVVRIEGPTPPKGHPRHVVFTCEKCVFAPVEQHQFDDGTDHAKDDDGKTIPSAYDTKPVKGHFGVYVLLEAPVVAGTYRVRAEPVANKGEKSVTTWFTLTTE